MLKFYSTGCPKCRILKQKLDKAQIEYELIDDEEVVLKEAERRDVSALPFIVDDNDVVYDFGQALALTKQYGSDFVCESCQIN